MKTSEQSPESRDVPYECNFILLPKKDEVQSLADVSGLNSTQGCFALEKRKK